MSVVRTCLGIFGVILFTTSSFVTAHAAAAPDQLQQAFNQAAADYGVPQSVLMAVAYNESRWEQHSGQSIDGGYGIMNLTSTIAPSDNKGDGAPKSSAQPASTKTLELAASLINAPANNLKTDTNQNIRGGAAVLASYAKKLNGNRLPASTDRASWYAAVANYSGASSRAVAQGFADDVYITIRNGQTSVTEDNQRLALPADLSATADATKMTQTNTKTDSVTDQASAPTPECPSQVDCRFIPAAYAQTDPNNPAVYGNYDPADRPQDMKIQYIIIHDTEGSYTSAIHAFQDPAYEVSTQYVIRSSDGQITQMVRNSDVAFGAGDFYVNMHGINIEHEGYANHGAKWYTEAMYQSSAKLVRYLCQKYGLPMDREHIIGHNDVPAPTAASLSAQHYDPGPYWDWNHYMALVNQQSDSKYVASLGTTAAPSAGQVVSIAPGFLNYKQSFTDCSDNTMPCKTLKKQSSSSVLLHTQPSNTSPYISDPFAHPDDSAGTNDISDWGSMASAGQRFVVSDRQGDWTAISVSGKKAWYYDPNGLQQVSRVTTAGVKLIPKDRLLHVYGVAYPETSVYPKEVMPPSMDVLYNVPYPMAVTSSLSPLQTDYFYDATFDYSKPYDHDIFHGKTKYYQVQINHRIGYVKASDVTQQ